MNSVAELWARVLEILRADMTSVAIDTWFSDAQAVDLRDNTLYLCIPSDFKRSMIDQRFLGLIQAALEQIFAAKMEVRLLREEDKRSYLAAPAGGDRDPMEGDSYTFENFVVGPSNQFAHAAALAVAEEQNRAYNPLFIYGDSGLGKTHLLYAIRHTARTRHPDWNIVYVKGEDFTNELIGAIQSGKTAEMREKYRRCNLFLMDDVQFIAGKIQTQEEFFYTFNTLHESGRQIVLTSDRTPSEINLLTDRLKTRFESGLLADVAPPPYETRMAIIKAKAAQLGTALPEDCCNYIAENITSNVRTIEGAVKVIKAKHELMQVPITLELVKSIISEINKPKANVITPDLVLEETAKYYSVTAEDIKGQSRSRNTVVARHVSVYLMRSLTNRTLNNIGDYLGGRDHSTILNSIKYVENNMKRSKDFSQTIEDITANINAKA